MSAAPTMTKAEREESGASGEGAGADRLVEDEDAADDRSEVYETRAGVAEHWKQAIETSRPSTGGKRGLPHQAPERRCSSGRCFPAG
jgi:hypothetical protein